MEEVIGMSRREINRHHIIRNVLEGKATQADAARVLGRTERQVRRICARVRAQGARGAVHELRGRASNHQIASELIEKALCALHDPLWEGFGPTFAKDKLQELHGISLGVCPSNPFWAINDKLKVAALIFQTGSQTFGSVKRLGKPYCAIT